MKLEPNQINEVLGLYEKYARILKIALNDLPVLTLNETEYKLALQGNDCYEPSIKRFRQKSVLGICTQKHKDFNSVINIKVEHKDHRRLYGQPIKTLSKEYTYKSRTGSTYICQDIDYNGTIEHTLIHELIHHVYPKQRHGKLFEYLISQAYKKGQTINNG